MAFQSLFCALQDEWRSISQLEIHHRGQYNFKGLTEEQSVWQINSALLANRRFPAGVSSASKGQMVEPGQGLSYIINFTDNATESSKPESGPGMQMRGSPSLNENPERNI